MKKLGLAIAAVAMVAFTGSAMADHVALLGNDLPHMAGKAEKLHIHAYDTCKEQEFEGSSRNVIMVETDYTVRGSHAGLNLVKTNDIFLVNAATEFVDDFTVLDGNACDNTEADGAKFALPSDIASMWIAFLRLRGKPNTAIDISLCYEDSGNIVCEVGVIKTRDSGKPWTKNVTSELLSEIDFTESPFWEVGTTGRLKATIYFYPCDAVNDAVIGSC